MEQKHAQFAPATVVGDALLAIDTQLHTLKG